MASRHLTLGHALVAFRCPCLVSLCLSASFLCLCHFSVSLFLFLSSSVSSLACSLTLCRCVFFYLPISLTACSFLGVPDFLCSLSFYLAVSAGPVSESLLPLLPISLPIYVSLSLPESLIASFSFLLATRTACLAGCDAPDSGNQHSFPLHSLLRCRMASQLSPSPLSGCLTAAAREQGHRTLRNPKGCRF